MLLRVSRAMNAAGRNDKASTGKIKSVGSFSPATLNQRSLTPNTYCRPDATTKFGMETPSTAIKIVKLSRNLR
ncbi:hypothetical protein D3C79_1056820 [compost metagenome]